jgi:type I restriction enzyme M protein
LQHIYLGLKPGGRAAVVLPDNVLFNGNVGEQIRSDLMDKCNLHTILRLPTGIFYAPGVKTNVLFFTRGKKDKGNTQEVWVYDLRTNMSQFGKRTQLTRQHFAEFEVAFGDDPLGSPMSLSKRVDTGEQGHFRKFTRDWIAERGDNLDMSWLKNENDELPEPATLAQEAMLELEAALEKLRGILEELGEEVEV